jgi:hypothetical protein
LFPSQHGSKGKVACLLVFLECQLATRALMTIIFHELARHKVIALVRACHSPEHSKLVFPTALQVTRRGVGDRSGFISVRIPTFPASPPDPTQPSAHPHTPIKKGQEAQQDPRSLRCEDQPHTLASGFLCKEAKEYEDVPLSRRRETNCWFHYYLLHLPWLLVFSSLTIRATPSSGHRGVGQTPQEHTREWRERKG